SSYRDAYFATADTARRDLIDLRVATARPAEAMFGDAAASRPWLSLPGDKVIAQFVSMPDDTIVLTASRNDGPRASRMRLTERELAALVDELVDGIERADERTQRDAADRFSRELPAPLTSASSLTNVVIIPDGPLYQMPFAAVLPDAAIAEAP